MSRTIFVTGGSGLIGAHLVPMLRERADVLAPSTGALDLANIGGAALPEAHAIVHLAQSPHYRDFPGSAEHVFGVNAASTLTLLQHALRVKAETFVLASTGSVYAKSDAPLTEDDAIALDAGFYPASKIAAEVIARSYAKLIDVVILRLFFVYGPQQKSTMLIPRLIDNVKNDRPLSLQGSGGLEFQPLHATDAARAIIGSMDLGGSHTFNVAGPEVRNLRQVGEAIGEALGVEPKFEVDVAAVAPRLVADITRLSERVGAPTIRFADGVAECVSSSA